MQKNKGPRITKTFFKKHKMRGFALPDIKTYYKAVVIQSVWHKDKQTVQWKDQWHYTSVGKGAQPINGAKRPDIYLGGRGNQSSTSHRTQIYIPDILKT